MTDDPRLDLVTRSIRALTVAVWCLCGLLAVQVAFYAWGYIASARRLRSTATMSRSTSLSPPASDFHPDPVAERPLHELPPEEIVKRSSVILLTSYQDAGERYKAVVEEILKQDPGVKLYYAVGDEYPSLSLEKRKDAACGDDGQIVFMVGSPASMRASYGFANGRIAGLGDMPVATLRDLIKRKAS